MKIYWTLFLLTISLTCFSQKESTIDSLIIAVCKTVREEDKATDSTRLLLAYSKHLFPFMDRFKENERERLFEQIYYRLQRNCRDFAEILDRLDPPKEDWVKLAEKPGTNLNRKQCRAFASHINFRYPDNGDTVFLTIDKGFWIDNFKDGTYSKLKFKWISDCEFEIEFIESNNAVRKQFSRPGDRYRYQIIDKKDDYYDLSAQIVGSDSFYLFKMFY